MVASSAPVAAYFNIWCASRSTRYTESSGPMWMWCASAGVPSRRSQAASGFPSASNTSTGGPWRWKTYTRSWLSTATPLMPRKPWPTGRRGHSGWYSYT